MAKLDGKTVVIIGASGGIGKVIAKTLHCHGATVVLAARTKEKLDTVAGELGQKRTLVAQMDASRPDDVRKTFADAIKLFGTVDAVVITAGTWKKLSVDSLTEDAMTLAENHYRGLFLPSFAVGFIAQSIMRKQGTGGVIINISSHAAVRPELEGNLTYGPLKAAARHFMLGLFHELKGTSVRVCDIQPAIVDTPDAAEMLNTPEKKGAAVKPEEIAEWVVEHLDDPNIPPEVKFEAKGGLLV